MIWLSWFLGPRWSKFGLLHWLCTHTVLGYCAACISFSTWHHQYSDVLVSAAVNQSVSQHVFMLYCVFHLSKLNHSDTHTHWLITSFAFASSFFSAVSILVSVSASLLHCCTHHTADMSSSVSLAHVIHVHVHSSSINWWPSNTTQTCVQINNIQIWTAMKSNTLHCVAAAKNTSQFIIRGSNFWPREHDVNQGDIHHTVALLIEHGLTSPPTQYRLYGRRFFTGQKTQPTVSKYWRNT